MLLGAANRDPAHYAEPGRFDPARRDSRPLSVGGAAHYCLGARLGRLEATVAFGRLPARFRALASAPGAEPVRRNRIFLSGHEVLPVVPNGVENPGI